MFSWPVQNQNRFSIFVKPVQPSIFVFPLFGSIEFSQILLFAWRRKHFKLRLLKSVENLSSNMFLRFYFVLCPLVNIMRQNPHYVNILILVSRFPVNWKAFDLSSSIETNPQMWQWLRPCSGVGAYWEGVRVWFRKYFKTRSIKSSWQFSEWII